MRRVSRRAGVLLTLAALLLLAGCGGNGQRDGTEGETVTIALWSDQLTEGYGQYLQRTFPSVDFQFYVATNSADFYRFKEQAEDLPDILTLRRFSLNDVSPWRDALADLSDSELANTFPQAYLRSYTYSDGTVNWLPACGEIDSILVNRSLLEENGLDIPANYQEFLDVCAALREKGIRPFRSNFGADYTCMEVLQGLSASRLASQEGREWRQLYESGQTDQLSGEVWLPVFQRMLDFLDQAGLGPADLEGSTADLFTAYQNRECAMIRATCGEAGFYGVGAESVMMPYYGDSPEDSWYLTYPAFQVAASARAEESPERKELIFSIMEAMLSQEGLRHVANGQNMIAYNRGVELERSPLLSGAGPLLEANQLYIRLASSDMFSASQKVVQGMLAGTYTDARSAFDAFNEAMGGGGAEATAAARIETGYAYAFEPGGGSPAASAVMNTLREELGTELLAGQSVNVAGNIAAGDYTREELDFLTMGESVDILLCTMTGEQLFHYLSSVLTASGRRGSVINDSALYVSSGFEMEVRRTEEGYVLEELRRDGGKLDRARTYSVALLGSELMMHGDLLAAAGITDYEEAETPFKQLVAERLAEGKQLAPPTDYITLH
ncbi:extracellular solute-binding protein [uncultured Oscillibacter sp.]|uniref:extracellular solute-binding protein n=1 Tax=uncultured Oscillibacter sp. TaxID=876091 RepID=UPI002603539F|nr:extracellular solute-binding protein [uncultured Oscillibacter sp.]